MINKYYNPYRNSELLDQRNQKQDLEKTILNIDSAEREPPPYSSNWKSLWIVSSLGHFFIFLYFFL